MQFNKWKHPQTGQQRIYINGLSKDFVKAYVEHIVRSPGLESDDYAIRLLCFASEQTNVDGDSARESVLAFVKHALRLKREPRFHDFLTLADHAQ